jgi:hypothetical protein
MGTTRAYTTEQVDWLRENYPLMPLDALHTAFNAQFGQARTRDAIKATLGREKITSGRTGRFEQGQHPWNRGSKGIMRANVCSFKKGNVPPNRKPLYSERICTKDGYINISVPERNPYTGAVLMTHPSSLIPHQQLTVQGYPVRTGPGGAYIPKTIQAQQYLIQWRKANADAPDAWLRRIISEAFQRMISRRMQDAPAADVIQAVAEDWIDIVGEGMTEELDAERIIAGFRLLFRECRRWPQPSELLKRLSRRPSTPLRGHASVEVEAVDEEAHARGSAALADILEGFK